MMITDKSQSENLEQSTTQAPTNAQVHTTAQDRTDAQDTAHDMSPSAQNQSTYTQRTYSQSVAAHYDAREYATPQPYYADHYIDEASSAEIGAYGEGAVSPISIDEDARDTLDRYFYENPLSPIRIYITTRSPKGPKLALRPDKQTDKDLAFEAEDYTFLISPHLAHQLGHIRIAAYDMGFEVIPEHPLHHKKHH